MGKVFKRPGRTAWHYKVRLANGYWQQRVGYTDKRATEERQAKEQREIDRGEVGLVDPYAATRRASLEGLVAKYAQWLRARARAERYVQGVEQRLGLVLEVTGAHYLQDLDSQAVESFLGRLVRGEDLPAMPARPNTVVAVPRGPASMRTRDSYVEALRTFGAWLYQSERWGSNPFDRLRRVARESDRTMEHRALSLPELELLVQAAEVRNVQQWVRGSQRGGGHSQAAPSKLDELREQGYARGTLYLFAAYTGLRLNECRQLLRSHLTIDGDEPNVLVRAKDAKARTEMRVPLVAPLVERLREYLRRTAAAAGRAQKRVVDGGGVVFRLPRNLLTLMRKDAAFAGLGLHDDVGRVLTFHGLRASTATLLARAGVSVATAMRVLRHSDANLTLRVYAKLGLTDVHRELREKLLSPQVSPKMESERAAVGFSVPVTAIGAAATAAIEAARVGRLVPPGAAQCRSDGEPASRAKWWAVQDSNLPVPRHQEQSASAVAGAVGAPSPQVSPKNAEHTVSDGGAAGSGDSGDEGTGGSGDPPGWARLAGAVRTLLSRSDRGPIPAALRADLQRLLAETAETPTHAQDGGPCWSCGGDEVRCWACGERERECECAEPNLGECETCRGTGTVGGAS